MNTKGTTRRKVARTLKHRSSAVTNVHVRGAAKKDPAVEAAMKAVWLVKDKKTLVPLSGKERPDRIDIEILQRDRQGLELIIAAILADGRLASQIVKAYAEERSLYLVPKETWEKAKGGAYLA